MTQIAEALQKATSKKNGGGMKIGKGWEETATVKFLPKKVENTEVLETNKYDIFKKDAKNRPIHEEKVVFFLKQFRAGKYFMREFPMVVDKNNTILDGQHRYEAARRLDLPIYFRYATDLTIDNVVDVQINAGWKTSDFIHAFIKQGKQDYVVLHRFMARYNLPVGVAIGLLRNVQRIKIKKSGFYDGTFTVKDETKAHAACKMIYEVGSQCNDIHKDRTFMMALMNAMAHPDYKQKRMVEQIRKYPSLVGRFTTTNAALRNLEELYNYRRYKENKIRFL